MRKLLFGVSVALILALLLINPLVAQDEVGTPEFASLAPYASMFYADIRADSGYFETLDGVIAQVIDALPPGSVPVGASIGLLLDQLSQTVMNENYAQGLGTVVGDRAGVVVASLNNLLNASWQDDNQLQAALYLNIEDGETAMTLVANALQQSAPADALTIESVASGMYYAVEPDFGTSLYILVTNDILVASLVPEMLPLTAREAHLSDYAPFVETVAALPADDYNAIIYVDVAYFGTAITGADRWRSFNERLVLSTLSQALGTWALGATILDGRTLTADLVVRPGSTAALDALGINLRGAPEPVDAALLSRLPTDTALVWHGSEPLGVVELTDQVLSGMFDAMTGSILDTDPVSAAQLEAIGRSLGVFPNALLASFTGLTADRLATWLTGDYLVVMRPNLDYVMFDWDTGLPFEFGVILEAADAAASREAMLALARDLPLAMQSFGANRSGLNFYPTRIGGAEAVIMEVQVEDFSRDTVAGYSLAVAADDGVLVAGTLGVVSEVIGNADRESSPFEASQAYILPNSTLALYVNPIQTAGLLTPIFYVGPPWEAQRNEVILALLSLLDDSTASLTFDEAGNTLLRMTLTLANDQEANAAIIESAADAYAEMATQTFGGITGAFATPTPSPTPLAMVITPTPFPSPTPGGAAAEIPLQIGGTYNGNLAAGVPDRFSFQGTPGQPVTITMDGVGFDTYLEVFERNGGVLAANDDRGDGSLNSQIVGFNPPYAGTFIIVARSFGNTGSGPYTLSLTAEGMAAPTLPPTWTPTPTPTLAGGTTGDTGFLTYGASATNNLPTGERQTYTFEGRGGDIITIDVQSTEFDTTVTLIGPAGSQIAFNDDFGTTRNSRLENVTLPSSGTYSIAVGSFADVSGGAYTVTLSRESDGNDDLRATATQFVAEATMTAVAFPTATPAPTSTISDGEQVRGSLVSRAQDRYTFEANAGDFVTIDLSSSVFDTYLEVYDAAGTLVVQNDDRQAGNLNALINRFRIPSSGTFTIVVRGYLADASGAYTLTLSIE
jgi:hypothetical protein